MVHKGRRGTQSFIRSQRLNNDNVNLKSLETKSKGEDLLQIQNLIKTILLFSFVSTPKYQKF